MNFSNLTYLEPGIKIFPALFTLSSLNFVPLASKVPSLKSPKHFMKSSSIPISIKNYSNFELPIENKSNFFSNTSFSKEKTSGIFSSSNKLVRSA